MLWPRLVVLLLLPLWLWGCWDLSTRQPSPETASSSQYGFYSPGWDDLPTPRLFQLKNSSPAE